MSSEVVAALAAATDDPLRALAAVVRRAAEARGTVTCLVVDGEIVPPDRRVMASPIDDSVLVEQGPWLPGMLMEALATGVTRRRRGVHHTDPDVARVVTDLALEGHDRSEVVVGDPSIGGGVFLLAAAELLSEHADPADVVARLRGIDVDPVAVAVTRAALELWAGGPVDPSRLTVGDFLDDTPFGADPVDVVVGNPPFLGQLRSETARGASRALAARRRWPDVGGYADEAGLFLLAALEAVSDRGSVALIQPSSVLSARDYGPIRRRVLASGAVSGFWAEEERVFRAEVDTCALVVTRGRPRGPVTRRSGRDGRPMPDHPSLTGTDSWAGLLADLVGVPAVRIGLSDTGTLGDVARCTAGFRDHFYGLRDAVTDDPRAPIRLITSGLIDPLRCRWGERACRYDRRRWSAPGVELDDVDPGVSAWVEERLRPKLVVASQTMILEAAVDEDGIWVPCTPVVSVEPVGGAPSLWHLAAALLAPQASAWLAEKVSGSALSPFALRVSASRLAGLPLPEQGPAWDAAAAAARAAVAAPTAVSLQGAGVAAGRAYGGASPELLDWWCRRLPRESRDPGAGS